MRKSSQLILAIHFLIKKKIWNIALFCHLEWVKSCWCGCCCFRYVFHLPSLLRSQHPKFITFMATVYVSLILLLFPVLHSTIVYPSLQSLPKEEVARMCQHHQAPPPMRNMSSITLMLCLTTLQQHLHLAIGTNVFFLTRPFVQGTSALYFCTLVAKDRWVSEV